MKKLMLAAIRFYQRNISPSRPACCRFIPTCSQYALEAIQKYGPLKGGWLAVKRRSRCVGARYAKMNAAFLEACGTLGLLREDRA